MKKIDFKKELKNLYRPSDKEVVMVNVPPMSYLMVDGAGDPNTSQEFKDAVEALYSLSYALKFMVKKGETAIDYGVMPLEGLWWAEDMASFEAGDKKKWMWTLMTHQPEYITKELVAAANEQTARKKSPAALKKVRFETHNEGKAAQILHIGPFSEEGPTIRKVRQFIEEKKLKISGKHHEIYLSDLRKTAPEKWKTVIRQPVA